MSPRLAFLATLPSNPDIIPLRIVGDARAFLAGLCASSEHLVGTTAEMWELKPLDAVRLDVGGMITAASKDAETEIDGVRFLLALEHAGFVAHVFSRRGHERVPGWWRVIGWPVPYAMPIPTWERVKAWTRDVADSDLAGTAHQRREDVLNGHAAAGRIVRFP